MQKMSHTHFQQLSSSAMIRKQVLIIHYNVQIATYSQSYLSRPLGETHIRSKLMQVASGFAFPYCSAAFA